MTEREPRRQEKLNLQKFEEAKTKFMREIQKAPDLELTDLQKSFHRKKISSYDIFDCVLDFLSLYGVKKSFGKIEQTMEKVIRKKIEEEDPHYFFADGIFRGGCDGPFETQSRWEMYWGCFGIYGSVFDKDRISITEEEKARETFSNTRLWKKKLEPKMKTVLAKFKQDDSESKQKLEDVFVISKDVIQAL